MGSQWYVELPRAFKGLTFVESQYMAKERASFKDLHWAIIK